MLLVLLPGLRAGEGDAAAIVIAEPAADRWMYPANATPGTRPQASTFSALPDSGGADDRFGQFVFRFDTAAAGIPAGLGPEHYEIAALRITAMVAQDDLFVYQPDADGDLGHPMELHGTGFRNGFTAADFAETSPFSSAGTRNAFALGFDATGAPRDVSNNVTEGFASRPWATGAIAALAPGDPVKADTPVAFEIDPGLPGVADYLRRGLDRGALWFTLSSLHPAVQQGGEFVSYYTRDSLVHELFGDAAPRLELEVAAPPPPRLLSFGRDPADGAFVLRWTGVPGFTDVVEAADDPGADAWEDLGSFSPESEEVLEWRAAHAGGRRFFRISRSLSP